MSMSNEIQKMSNGLSARSHLRVATEYRNYNYSDKRLFRVAVSSDCDDFCGGHAERRDYGDWTVGYTRSVEEAYELLVAAAYIVQKKMEEEE